MEYTERVLDRITGELIKVSAGDWITITELGELKGVTPRRVRTILRAMDFLYVAGGQAHSRHRLSPWVLKHGLGRHIPAGTPTPRYPFDVISPGGQAWIEGRWSDTVATLEAQPSRPVVVQAREALSAYLPTRFGGLDTHGRVLWLRYHFPDLTDTEVAGILDVTQQLVSRYARVQEAQVRLSEMSKVAPLKDIVKVQRALHVQEVV